LRTNLSNDLSQAFFDSSQFGEAVPLARRQLMLLLDQSGRMKEFARLAMDMHQNPLVAVGNCNVFSAAGDPYLPFGNDWPCSPPL
jgi:hypothetical protein